MGRSITQAFVGSNATVISTYVNDREPSQGGPENKSSVQLIKADVTKDDDVGKLVSDITGKYGHIHILVNVVGGYIRDEKACLILTKKSGIK